MCTINDNHMMHGSWDMEHNKQIFFSFWTFFCPFTPLTTDYHFTHVYNIWKSYDCSWDTERDRQNFLPLAIFCTFTLVTTWKIKILKKWKRLEISSFSTGVPKIMITWCTVSEKWCATDGHTGRRTDRKSNIKKWVPHLKHIN